MLYCNCYRDRGRVAQLGEHGVRNAGVGGSNPPTSTTPTTHPLAAAPGRLNPLRKISLW